MKRRSEEREETRRKPGWSQRNRVFPQPLLSSWPRTSLVWDYRLPSLILGSQSKPERLQLPFSTRNYLHLRACLLQD